MRRKKSMFILFLLSIGLSASAQNFDSGKVHVNSWKKGDERVIESSLKITLSSENPRYEKEVISHTGKKYKLSVVPYCKAERKTEFWKVELREAKPDESTGEMVGDDLLFVERPGAGGDNFPKEDYISYFYPYEGEKVTLNGSPWIDGHPFYPAEITREIQVENFMVVLKAGKFTFNKKTAHKMDAFELSIELINLP
jgi:hypothetical protein